MYPHLQGQHDKCSLLAKQWPGTLLSAFSRAKRHLIHGRDTRDPPFGIQGGSHIVVHAIFSLPIRRAQRTIRSRIGGPGDQSATRIGKNPCQICMELSIRCNGIGETRFYLARARPIHSRIGGLGDQSATRSEQSARVLAGRETNPPRAANNPLAYWRAGRPIRHAQQIVRSRIGGPGDQSATRSEH